MASFRPSGHEEDRVYISSIPSEGTHDEPEDESNVLKRGPNFVGITKDYADRWTEKKAFRELYQNWKDAIVASFDLDPRSFKPNLEERHNEILISVSRKSPTRNLNTQGKDLLGYIRFDMKSGSLELINFQATLKKEYLHIGGSSKRLNQDRFAGGHGEGLKIAALVMSRNRHKVTISASSYNWNFYFRAENFYCFLTKAKDSVIKEQEDEFGRLRDSNALKRLPFRISKDVKIIVWKGREGQGGRKITKDEFHEWLTVVLDINGPMSGKIIQTEKGDLILDRNFKGKIYVKSLQVPGCNSSGREYYFGYNFAFIELNRDRERLVSSWKEAETVADIWQKAIVKRGDSITDQYIKLFHEHENCADIALAENVISFSAAKAIWCRLRTRSPDSFFYCNDDWSLDVGDQAMIISRDLKRKPEILPRTLWKIFRNFSLVRSPKEERDHQFEKAEMVTIPQETFALHVSRVLSASLAMHRQLRDAKIEFVKGGHSQIDLLFCVKKKVFRVHERWLKFRSAHELNSCTVSRLDSNVELDNEAFLCDHVVEDLFSRAINDARSDLKLSPSECDTLRHESRERTQEMPRVVKCAATEHVNELEVSWKGNESSMITRRFGSQMRYIVILHAESSCWTGRTGSPRWLYDATSKANPWCKCPYKIILHEECTAIFNDLDPHKKYFPMVARAEDKSFFGLPPPPIAPSRASGRAPKKFPRETSAISSASFHNLRGSNTILSGNLTGNVSRDSDNCEGRYLTDWISSGNDRSFPANSYTSGNVDVPHVATDDQDEMDIEKDLEPPKVGKLDQMARTEAEQQWRIWHEEEMMSSFRRFLPTTRRKCPQSVSSISDLDVPHLEVTFNINEYYHIRLGAEADLEHIILVHDINCDQHGIEGHYLLMVTKYSFLGRIPLFESLPSHQGKATTLGTKELLLHSTDYSRMGLQADAEVIQVNSISEARHLHESFGRMSDRVAHVGQAPFDVNNCGLFCRFAICSNERDFNFSITPVGSHLLGYYDRKPLSKFDTSSVPVVYDLTPGVLGPSLGFSMEQYPIHAGIGFDEEHDTTWKAWHPDSVVLDGAPPEILDEFESGKLNFPTPRAMDVPRVALIAGRNENFRLSDDHHHLPSAEKFLEPLDIFDAATRSNHLKADSLVSMMPPALLHHSTTGRFSQTILNLLEQNFSVHIKLTALQDHCLPQARKTLVIVGSRLHTPFAWSHNWPINVSNPPTTVENVIGDLKYENHRASSNAKGGFACPRPVDDVCAPNDSRTAPNAYLYNHQTGCQSPHASPQTPIDMGATSIPIHRDAPTSLIHPTRGDLLTVREIARLQGFSDDDIFYSSESVQHQDVTNALPPIVARRTAQTILHMIQQSQAPRVSVATGAMRGVKRMRLLED